MTLAAADVAKPSTATKPATYNGQMANTVALDFAAKTDTGLIRTQNEDCVLVNPACDFAVLADGMGGYNAGEVASRIATTITMQVLEQGLDSSIRQKVDLRSPRNKQQLHQLLIEAIQQANTEILKAADADPQCNGMGTTLVAALFQHDRLIVAHVGDSRAYRLRHGELTQITRDHSLLQEQIDAGLIDPEWAQYSQHRNLVTRAVGVGPEMEVELHEHHIEEGDLIMLCSDGLTDMLVADEIRAVLMQQHTSLDFVCDALIKAANEKGGHDNISVILVRVKAIVSEAPSLLGRIRNWMK